MDADIKLDGDTVTVEGRVIKTTASDLMLDNAEHRKNSTQFRRALVHNKGDRLTLNYAGDYPGGVSVEGGQLTVQQLRVANPKVHDTGGRALVQDEKDTLVLNEGDFYKGGVRVDGGHLRVEGAVHLNKSLSVAGEIAADRVSGKQLIAKDLIQGRRLVILDTDVMLQLMKVEDEMKQLQGKVLQMEAQVQLLDKH